MQMSLREHLSNLLSEERLDEYFLLATEAGLRNRADAIESLFLLFIQLVYPESDSVPRYKEMVDALRKLSNVFREEYGEDAEYNFFVGYFMALSEWAFSQDDFETSHRMLKKASEIDPTSRLYDWGYRFSMGDRSAQLLTRELVNNREQLEQLRSKGKFGEFIAEAIEAANQEG